MVHTVQTQENELRSLQLQKLNRLLHFVLNHNEFYKEKLAGLKLPLQSLEEMKKLPFTMKKELVDDQNNHPPYGKNHSYPLEEYVRYHQTSGTSGKPLKILDTKKALNGGKHAGWKFIAPAELRKKTEYFSPFRSVLLLDFGLHLKEQND